MKNPTFLLIDDDQDDHYFFTSALHVAFPEAACHSVYNCPEAISCLKNESIPLPNYIFMDWSMPYMQAIDCIKALKEISGIETTPIYILSGSKPSFEIEHIVGLHIKQVLKKQNSIEQLALNIKKAVSFS